MARHDRAFGGEILIVDPAGSVTIYACGTDDPAPVEHSAVLDVAVTQIAAAISWPT